MNIRSINDIQLLGTRNYYGFFLHVGLASFVFLMLLFTYIPITHLSFAVPDDTWMLLKNREVRPSAYSFGYYFKVFTVFNDNQYSPLITLYYHLIYKINGYDPYYYHLFSFVLHCLNVTLIGLLSYRLLSAFNISNRIFSAYIISLIWGIHPLNVEPTVWISAVKIGWFCFFSLLSFLFFIKGFETSRHTSFIFSILFFLLSCFCKEQSIITPFIFLSYVICCRMKARRDIFKIEGYTGYICLMFAITLFFSILTYEANNLSSTNTTPIIHYSIAKRIALSFYCLNFYLTSFLMPIGLHYHYSYPIQPRESLPLLLVVYPFLLTGCLLFLGYLLKCSEDKYFYLFCILFFAFEICLVLQIIPMTRPAIMADRYMYLPLFALLLVVIPFVVELALTRFHKSWTSLSAMIIFFLYILFLSVYSQQLVSNWAYLNLIT
ncbi:hypothetical protein J2T02_003964 [Chitinophaga terrae (ex Kim and Jung 2007)]|nr:hypothetical protein [Chitinophaga terrae (ex Kim and Jung 2007)]